MIGLLSWIATGLVVGVAARFLLPGPSSGWAVSMGVALAGALAGGLVATLLDMGGLAELDIRGLALASLMAALAVLLAQLVRVLRAGPKE